MQNYRITSLHIHLYKYMYTFNFTYMYTFLIITYHSNYTFVKDSLSKNIIYRYRISSISLHANINLHGKLVFITPESLNTNLNTNIAWSIHSNSSKSFRCMVICVAETVLVILWRKNFCWFKSGLTPILEVAANQYLAMRGNVSCSRKQHGDPDDCTCDI